ncbi:MAG TPA: hypothetical protein VE010_02240, partial [Thermoanaerobaculia bacterium]|nr:hypothetical protein [Thermoanaerobaculia bacterium]
RLRDVGAALMPGTIAGLIMTAADVAWLRWAASYPPIAQLAGGIAIGAIVYIVALILLDRNLIAAVRHHLGGPRHAVGST